jgi:hypothetical protein
MIQTRIPGIDAGEIELIFEEEIQKVSLIAVVYHQIQLIQMT